MNCGECQGLINTFLDNELDEKSSEDVRTHLAICDGCAKICEDFAMILDFCQLEEAESLVPPNSKALWCRINNIIECESAEILQEVPKQPEPQKRGFGRIWNSTWQFSLSQVFSMVLGIALISSLLTVLGVKNYRAGDHLTASASVSDSILDKALGELGLVETQQQARERRIKEQQTAIDYWNKRVEAKRAKWDNDLREAFDRNLNEVNQVVFEYDRILRENPHDELSGEMLDTALKEKMELLRGFSEL